MPGAKCIHCETGDGAATRHARQCAHCGKPLGMRGRRGGGRIIGVLFIVFLLVCGALAVMKYALHMDPRTLFHPSSVAQTAPLTPAGPQPAPAPVASPAIVPDEAPAPDNIFTGRGSGSPPAAPMSTKINRPGGGAAPALVVPSESAMKEQIAAAQMKLKQDETALRAIEAERVASLASDPGYQSALAARAAASAKARAAAQGEGDLASASHELTEATQRLSDLKRLRLASEQQVTQARAQAKASEAALVQLLQQRGVKVVAAPPGDATPPPPSGPSLLFGDPGNEVFIRGTYRKDGTYVPSQVRQTAPSAGRPSAQ